MRTQLGFPVHFVNHQLGQEAAIITQVNSETNVNLFVMHPGSGCETLIFVPFDETGTLPYSWHGFEDAENDGRKRGAGAEDEAPAGAPSIGHS